MPKIPVWAPLGSRTAITYLNTWGSSTPPPAWSARSLTTEMSDFPANLRIRRSTLQRKVGHGGIHALQTNFKVSSCPYLITLKISFPVSLRTGIRISYSHVPRFPLLKPSEVISIQTIAVNERLHSKLSSEKFEEQEKFFGILSPIFNRWKLTAWNIALFSIKQIYEPDSN